MMPTQSVVGLHYSNECLWGVRRGHWGGRTWGLYGHGNLYLDRGVRLVGRVNCLISLRVNSTLRTISESELYLMICITKYLDEVY